LQSAIEPEYFEKQAAAAAEAYHRIHEVFDELGPRFSLAFRTKMLPLPSPLPRKSERCRCTSILGSRSFRVSSYGHMEYFFVGRAASMPVTLNPLH
jgi:hypothetical protein